MARVASTAFLFLCCSAALTSASRPSGDDTHVVAEAAERTQIIAAATAAARALTNAVRDHAAALLQHDQDTGVDQTAAQRQREKVLRVTVAQIHKTSLSLVGGSSLFERKYASSGRRGNESLPQCVNETISKTLGSAKLTSFMGQCSTHVDELARLAVAINETRDAISTDATTHQVENMRKIMSHIPPLADHSCTLMSCLIQKAKQAKPSWLSDEGYSMWCDDSEHLWQKSLARTIGLGQLQQMAEVLSKNSELDHKQMGAVIAATLQYIPECFICRGAHIGHPDSNVQELVEDPVETHVEELGKDPVDGHVTTSIEEHVSVPVEEHVQEHDDEHVEHLVGNHSEELLAENVTGQE